MFLFHLMSHHTSLMFLSHLMLPDTSLMFLYMSFNATGIKPNVPISFDTTGHKPNVPISFDATGHKPNVPISFNMPQDTSLMFLGGMLMAVSIENSGLHERVALGMLRLVGSKPRWILLGFMLPTWFLSMWISNTATTAMMLPVGEAVLLQLEGIEEDGEQNTKEGMCLKTFYIYKLYLKVQEKHNFPNTQNRHLKTGLVV